MTSYEYRNDPMFLRNQYETHGKYGFAYIRKQEFEFTQAMHLAFIALTATKLNDSANNCSKIAHGFLDDHRLNVFYNSPDKHKQKLSQYLALIPPDYSAYREMDRWRMIESIAHNRWVGKHWQESWGMDVIASVTWGAPSSFDFCFDGIEPGSWVAISVIGNRTTPREFMLGYDAMLEHIAPSGIICLDKPYPEMRGNIIYIPYIYPKQSPSTQLWLPFAENSYSPCIYS